MKFEKSDFVFRLVSSFDPSHVFWLKKTFVILKLLKLIGCSDHLQEINVDPASYGVDQTIS